MNPPDCFSIGYSVSERIAAVKTFNKIDHIFVKISHVLVIIAGVMCFLMMVLSVLNVITRSMFDKPILGTVELVSYFGLTLGALALAMNELCDGNVTMTLFIDTLKPKAKKALDAVMTALAAVLYAVITYRYLLEVQITLKSGTHTSTLGIHYYVINAIMTIGFLFALLALLVKIGRDVAFIATGGKEENGGAEA